MSIFLAQSEADVIAEELGNVLEEAPSSPAEALEVVTDQLASLWTGFLESLPIVLIGVIVFALAVMLALAIASAFRRGLDRSSADPVATRLLGRIVRSVLIIIAGLFALSVMGVSVGNVVTVLAVLGFAIGLALQGILENFVAGVILLMRKPFRAGDQIISGDFEGTVEDIDFRVTTLIGYDGTTHLVPNGEVYNSPLTNLTRRGKRRTTVTIGVDYRDDQYVAKQVLEKALAEVEGVLGDPPSEALLTELGDSSVKFELRYWTKPDIRSVRSVQGRVLADCKKALEDAGMTIPWPIRTLVVDGDSDIRVAQRRHSDASG